MARFTKPFRLPRAVPPGLKTLAVLAVVAILLTVGQVHLQGRMVQAQTVAADRAALVALYDAAGGDSWTNNDGWKSDQPLGDWHGVTTNTDGRVTILELNGNNLMGPIPAELGDLGELTDIGFYDNQLTGLIPPELGELNRLVSLLLHNNSLMGNVPPELSQLSSMTTMSIDRNQLTGPLPYSFTGLSSLTQFRFRDNAGLCAPLDSDFQTWFQGLPTRQGDNCPLTRIRSGAPAPVVGEPVTARLTSREARLARIQATQQEYDGNPCLGYDASRNLNSPWSWERAEANSSDPSLPDGNTWTPVSAGRHPHATFVYLPETGDVGKFLRASVSYSGTSVTTEAIGPIMAENGLDVADLVLGPAPTGTLRVGRTLRASLPAAAAAEREDRAINPNPEPWQWERTVPGGAPTTNVTPYHRHCERPDSEYRLTTADRGGRMSGYVYYNDDSSGSSVLKQGLVPTTQVVR